MVKRKRTQDPGTGSQYNFNAKRIINKDGSFNVKKAGLRRSTRNTYQSLIKMTWSRFFLVVFAFLFFINGIFAIFYTAIGVEYLGKTDETSLFDQFLYACYFSFQTFTTVGYGFYHPMGHLVNILSAVESVLGWMCFALITGLLYGRFSRPSARLLYSEKALITPYKKGLSSLQFRIANMRNSLLMEMETTVLLAFVDKSKGTWKREFVRLPLERDFILFFPLTWTVVHPIDEESPFYQKSERELKEMDIEILIRMKGYDDTFAQTVHSRHSYKLDEIVWGGRYHQVFEVDNNGDIQLYFDKMHDYEKLNLQ